MTVDVPQTGVRVRSVFLSDIHLGTLECQAERLLDFLESVQMERLYLVGDIVDLWSLKGGLYWPRSHAAVLRMIFSRARAGTRVVFVPGNHDERLREFCGHQFGNIEVLRDCIHETGDGRRFLVLHGDEFDAVMKCGRFMGALGTHLYDLFLRWGYRLNRARQLFGLGHWSLVTWLKGCVGNVRRHVERFEQVAAIEARRRGLDGVVCGHIHRPQVTALEGVLYCNDGDWVEHCTALVENQAGQMQLWTWPERSVRQSRRVSEWPEAA